MNTATAKLTEIKNPDIFEKEVKGKWIKKAVWFAHHHPIQFIEWVPNTVFKTDDEFGCFFIGQYEQGTRGEFKFSNKTHWVEVPLTKERQEIMSTTPHYDSVHTFMHKAGQAVPDAPCIPDKKTIILRAKLMLEEVLETVHAMGVTVLLNGGDTLCDAAGVTDLLFDCHDECDLIEVLDGCCDVAVVTTGTLIAFGIKDYYPQKAINDSNLAKFGLVCTNCGAIDDGGGIAKTEAASAALENHKHAVECNHCHDMWIKGHKRDDGKWIKPTNWQVPDMKQLLRDQGAPEEILEFNLLDTVGNPPPSTVHEDDSHPEAAHGVNHG